MTRPPDGGEDDRSPSAGVTPGRRAAVAAAVAAENAAVEELYENAPCGYLSTLPDGTIVKINATLVGWLGHQQEDLVGAAGSRTCSPSAAGSTTRRTSRRC